MRRRRPTLSTRYGRSAPASDPLFVPAQFRLSVTLLLERCENGAWLPSPVLGEQAFVDVSPGFAVGRLIQSLAPAEGESPAICGTDLLCALFLALAPPLDDEPNGTSEHGPDATASERLILPPMHIALERRVGNAWTYCAELTADALRGARAILGVCYGLELEIG